MTVSTEIGDRPADFEAVRLCLQEAPLFFGLADAYLVALSQLCRVVTYNQGDIIFYESSAGTELFITAHGQASVEIRLPCDQHTTSIYQVGKHEIFGEFALLDGHRRSATMIANKPLTTYVIPREELFALMDEAPPLGYAIMRNLGNILAAKLRSVNLDLRGLIANQQRLFDLVV